MGMHIRRRLLALAAAALVLPSLNAQPTGFDKRILAPYVPTPPLVVERMLELAGVTKDDVVYDLGSGDGRIVIAAARDYGARAVGIEIDGDLVKKSRERIRKLGLENRVRVIHGNLLETDLNEATVVTLYLLGSSNLELRPKLEKDLSQGARIVSHDFRIMGWTPVKKEVFNQKARTHKLFLYVAGKKP